MKVRGLLHFGLAAFAFWAGVLLFPKTTQRGPASTSNIYDYSSYKFTDFVESAKVAIVQETRATKTRGTYNIVLGHVYGPDRSVSMCEHYRNILLVFKAEGMASHGEVPQLALRLPCEQGSRLTQTKEYRLPFKKIMEQPLEDGRLIIEDADGEVTLQNADSDWPVQWYLDSISLIDSISGRSFNINLNEIRKIKRKNIELYW